MMRVLVLYVSKYSSTNLLLLLGASPMRNINTYPLLPFYLNKAILTGPIVNVVA